VRKSCVGYLIANIVLISILSACSQPLSTQPSSRPTDIVVAKGVVEDLVIEASVKTTLCLLDPPDFCKKYEIEYEEEREKDESRECYAVTEKFSGELEAYTINFEPLREEFSKYAGRNWKSPSLPSDLEWIVQLNIRISEKILEELFKKLYGPEVAATSDTLVACKKVVEKDYGKVFRLCIMSTGESGCFPIVSAKVTQQPSYQSHNWDPNSLVPGSGVPLYVTPNSKFPLGTGCGWLDDSSVNWWVCPQQTLQP